MHEKYPEKYLKKKISKEKTIQRKNYPKKKIFEKKYPEVLQRHLLKTFPEKRKRKRRTTLVRGRNSPAGRL